MISIKIIIYKGFTDDSDYLLGIKIFTLESTFLHFILIG